MYDTHLYAELLVDMFCQMLCRIDAAVLSACTSETEHQACESALDIAAHMSISKFIHAVEECQYLSVVLKETYNRFVKSRKFLVRLISSGIMGAAAVEHITTAVARLVFRYSLVIREAVDANHKRTFVVIF